MWYWAWITKHANIIENIIFVQLYDSSSLVCGSNRVFQVQVRSQVSVVEVKVELKVVFNHVSKVVECTTYQKLSSFCALCHFGMKLFLLSLQTPRCTNSFLLQNVEKKTLDPLRLQFYPKTRSRWLLQRSSMNQQRALKSQLRNSAVKLIFFSCWTQTVIEESRSWANFCSPPSG